MQTKQRSRRATLVCPRSVPKISSIDRRSDFYTTVRLHCNLQLHTSLPCAKGSYWTRTKLIAYHRLPKTLTVFGRLKRTPSFASTSWFDRFLANACRTHDNAAIRLQMTNSFVLIDPKHVPTVITTHKIKLNVTGRIFETGLNKDFNCSVDGYLHSLFLVLRRLIEGQVFSGKNTIIIKESYITNSHFF